MEQKTTNSLNSYISNLTETDKRLANAILSYTYECKTKLKEYRMDDMYDFYPTDIETFCISPYFLDLKGVIWDVVLQDLKLAYDHANYRKIIFSEGIGAGKSFKTAIIGLYEAYRLLCMKNPLAKYGTKEIVVLNMSVSEENALDVVFYETQRLYERSFFLKSMTIATGKGSIKFSKGIEFVCGNSKDTKALGRDIYVGILDEASWHKETDWHISAEDVYYALDRRVFSRFVRDGKVIVLSSPQYVNDFVQRLIESSNLDNEKADDTLIIKNRAFWESKPYDWGKMIDIDGYVIPEILIDEYKANPEKFKRDYMAIPSDSLEPYFKDKLAINKCAILDNNYVDGKIKDSYKPIRNCMYYGHIDLGLKKDACGMSIVHKHNGKIIADFIVRIKAEAGGEINFALVREIVYALKLRGFRIGKMTLDGWMSVDSIQQFTHKGITSEVLSVDRNLEPYDTLKELIYNGTLEMAKDDILIKELQQLELIKGKKVDHNRLGSKDVSDSLAGACFNCVSAETTKKEKSKIWIPSVFR